MNGDRADRAAKGQRRVLSRICLKPRRITDGEVANRLKNRLEKSAPLRLRIVAPLAGAADRHLDFCFVQPVGRRRRTNDQRRLARAEDGFISNRPRRDVYWIGSAELETCARLVWAGREIFDSLAWIMNRGWECRDDRQEHLSLETIGVGPSSSLDDLSDRLGSDRTARAVVSCSVKGEPAWPPLALFKAMLHAMWYDLSDVKLVKALATTERLFVAMWFLEARTPA